MRPNQLRLRPQHLGLLHYEAYVPLGSSLLADIGVCNFFFSTMKSLATVLCVWVSRLAKVRLTILSNRAAVFEVAGIGVGDVSDRSSLLTAQ